MRPLGTLMVLASAAAFGANGIFGKLAYDHGSTVGTLLATRFLVAAALFWVLALASGGLARVRRMPRRDVLFCLALGAIGYSAQAGAYFAALRRVDASLLALIVYTYPVMVAVSAIAVGREPATRRTAVVLGLAVTGLVLVLAGPATGGLDPLGTALGVAGAMVYTVYILVSERFAVRIEPLDLSTLICTGAAVTLTVAGVALSDVHPENVGAAGFGWLGAIAVVSTVGAISLFFAGIRRVGPTATAILSTIEPVVTICLAVVVFGESLTPVQLAGGALVLVAVLAVRTPTRTVPAEAPPAAVPAPATAG
jgi:drug/metabolite transporter (DMT)-like permease